MAAKIELGTYAGLRWTASRNVGVGMVIIAALVAVAALALTDSTPVEAIIGAVLCAVIHFLLEAWHQLGHAWAARRTGYPMAGAHFWWVLARSIYPSNEGELPGRIHIRRALGGPIGSGLLCIVLLVVVLALRPWTQLPGWVAVFALLDNIFVFTFGALLPLGFTDGSTLLQWWGK